MRKNLLCLPLLLLTTPALAVDMGLSYGLFSASSFEGLSMAGPLVEAASSHTMGISYWLDEGTRLGVNLGLAVALADKTSIALELSGSYRSYLTDGDARGFWQAGLGLSGLGADATDLGLGGGLGVEYFFNENISIAGMTGLDIAIPLGDHSDVGINSGSTGLTANLYW